MSKKFPDLKTDEEAEAWLQSADLAEYDFSDMKKVRFELARKDASNSLRLPAALLATLKAEAAKSQHADLAPDPHPDRGAIGRAGREGEGEGAAQVFAPERSLGQACGLTGREPNEGLRQSGPSQVERGGPPLLPFGRRACHRARPGGGAERRMRARPDAIVCQAPPNHDRGEADGRPTS
jgi:predicted DNA binding CopG/RHH family protein